MKKKDKMIIDALDNAVITTEKARDALMDEAAKVIENEVKSSAKKKANAKIDSTSAPKKVKTTAKNVSKIVIDNVVEETAKENKKSDNFLVRLVKKFTSIFH